jgi:hypothetical protein
VVVGGDGRCKFASCNIVQVVDGWCQRLGMVRQRDAVSLVTRRLF